MEKVVKLKVQLYLLLHNSSARAWARENQNFQVKMWHVGALIDNLLGHGIKVLKHASKRLNLAVPEQNPVDILNNFSRFGRGIPRQITIAESTCNTIATGSGRTGGVGSGVVRQLRPVTTRLVQSLIRKVSSPLWNDAKRQATKRIIFGETVPLFALVGVTLNSESEKGFLTKTDEVEALCGNIRDAISRMGWLHNPEYWENYNMTPNDTSEENNFEKHVFSLNDFEFGTVIDKGCNAVVYAAKWKYDPTIILKEQTDHTPSSSTSSLSDQSDVWSSASATSGESCNINKDIIHKLNEEEDEFFTASEDESETNLKKSASEYLDEEISPKFENRVRTTSLSENIARLMVDGRFLQSHKHKKVKFKYDEEEDCEFDLTKGTFAKRKISNARTDSIEEENLSCKEKYPLAVKMMFNYAAESNAPAVLSAMYKELIPARSIQLDETLSLWKENFLNNITTLSSHLNIVEMPCVFVDRIPSLESSMELYPQALPSRLNPDGFGRNMSLFCVMKRYDMSLSDYLSRSSPSNHTSLLLFAQLLEAVLHINENNIAHRDLKADNVLLSLSEGWEYPLLVLSDFGCCMADQKANLRVPFPSYESDPRQGNSALMAPEVKTAVPGIIMKIDYNKSDIWAVGAIAFELFGLENPFMPTSKMGHNKAQLDSSTYKDYQIPRLPKDISGPVRRLIYDLLRRNPKNRPSPTIAATLCQLILWAPSKWLNRHSITLPSHKEISQWLLCLTTKVLCEAKLNQTQKTSESNESPASSSALLEYQLVSTLLTRIRYSDIIQAIKWNRAF